MSNFEIKGKVTVDDQASSKMASIGKATKSLISGFSGLATSAFSLYDAYDRVQDAQLRVEKTELAVTRATEKLSDVQNKHKTLLNDNSKLTDEVAKAQANLSKVQNDATSSAKEIADAQDKLNNALDKLATNKDDTENALRDIEMAEENLRIKTEDVKNAQEDQQLAYATGALQAVTAIGTIITSVGQLTTAWKSVQVAAAAATGAEGLSGAAAGISKAAGTAKGGLGLMGLASSLSSIAAVAVPVAALFAGLAIYLDTASKYPNAQKDIQTQNIQGKSSGTSTLDATNKLRGAESNSATTGKEKKETPSTTNATLINILKNNALNNYTKYKNPSEMINAMVSWAKVEGGHRDDVLAALSGVASSKGWTASQLSSAKGMVPKFAEGGVIDTPTLALIGEGGEKEVVSPESLLKKIMVESLNVSHSGRNIVINQANMFNQIASTVDLEASLTRNNERIKDDLQRLLK